jgi:hypothetical protein
MGEIGSKGAKDGDGKNQFMVPGIRIRQVFDIGEVRGAFDICASYSRIYLFLQTTNRYHRGESIDKYTAKQPKYIAGLHVEALCQTT